jgi:hypothetical protein
VFPHFCLSEESSGWDLPFAFHQDWHWPQTPAPFARLAAHAQDPWRRAQISQEGLAQQEYLPPSARLAESICARALFNSGAAFEGFKSLRPAT